MAGGEVARADEVRDLLCIAALAHLDELKIANGDRGPAKERHDGQGGTYMDDPAGYVIQYITDGME